jgi:pyruvate dehydrogenase E2 component (dihydrolipoamide acetyltransferase)
MDVLMPQLGETVAEGKITQWFKSAGDAIAPGDNLFEIETDKVSMEVPSTSAGVLAEIRVAAGEVAPVGAVVAVIADKASTAASLPRDASALPAVKAAPAATGAPSRPSAPPVPAASLAAPPAAASVPIKLDPFFEVRTPERNFGPARLAGGTRVTPLARRLAAQGGIDLAGISPSGPNGRIRARDVETALASGKRAASAAAGPSADQIKALYRDVPFEEVPLDGMRRTIATRLVQATQTIPHFYLSADVEIGAVIKLREQANAAAPRDADGNPGFKLSVNDFVIKAWAVALRRVPVANAVWAEDRILRFRHSDIGVAVALEGGLITPIIRSADTKTLSAISRERRLRDLQSRHVRRARILRHHQSPAVDDPSGGRRAAAGDRDRGRRRRVRERDVGHALMRSSGGGRRAWCAAAGGVQGMRRATRHDAGVGAHDGRRKDRCPADRACQAGDRQRARRSLQPDKIL